VRSKPVTRNEIRFDGRCISTLPVDAVRKNDDWDIVPIRKLWAPLLRSLNRASKRKDKEWARGLANWSIEEELGARAASGARARCASYSLALKSQLSAIVSWGDAACSCVS
jgi:hypothetical protein